MEKDARLTPEFGTSIRLYLYTSFSSPWPIITREQIEARGVHAVVVGFSVALPRRIRRRRRSSMGWERWHGRVRRGRKRRRRPTRRDNYDRVAIRCHGTIPNPHRADTGESREFMLRDINAQVWQFVLQYLNSLTQFKMTNAIRVDALSFLICLGSARVGEGYHVSVLGKSKNLKQVMKDFGRFGLVFVCRVAGRVSFYPTRVAVILIASSKNATAEGGGGGRIAPTVQAL